MKLKIVNDDDPQNITQLHPSLGLSLASAYSPLAFG